MHLICQNVVWKLPESFTHQHLKPRSQETGFYLHQALILSSSALQKRSDSLKNIFSSFPNLHIFTYILCFTHSPTSSASSLPTTCDLPHHFSSFKFSVPPCPLLHSLLPARVEHTSLYFIWFLVLRSLSHHLLNRPVFHHWWKKPLWSYMKSPWVYGPGLLHPTGPGFCSCINHTVINYYSLVEILKCFLLFQKCSLVILALSY